MKNGKIEIQRLLFSIVIVLTHGKAMFSEANTGLFPRAQVGVDFFFFVSGYLMVCSAYKLQKKEHIFVGRETKQFIIKKISSLMPNYLIAEMIAFIVMISREEVVSFSLILDRFLSEIWEMGFIHMAGFGKWRANGVVWYISAMLLAMLILYPICIRFFDTYIHVLAPCLGIMLLGYLYVTFDLVSVIYEKVPGIGLYGGVVRAIADISMGAAAWSLIERMKHLRLKKIAKLLLSVSEIVILLSVLVYMQFASTSTYNNVIILLIYIEFIISFSHQGLVDSLFDNSVCYFLGRYSLSLYLGHVYWARWIGTKNASWNLGYVKSYLIYGILVFLTSIFIHYLSDRLRKARITCTLKHWLLES